MNSYECCSSNTAEKDQITAQLDLLKLISDENRLRILCVLEDGVHNVGELVGHLQQSQSLVSHHLADLRSEQIVLRQRHGRHMHYSLSKKGKTILQLLRKLSSREENL